jgi:hypothetical protein
MNRFDSLFFSQYVSSEEKILEVFHRHIFIVLEDIFLWVFFAVIIPSFLYAQNLFSIQDGISPVVF